MIAESKLEKEKEKGCNEGEGEAGGREGGASRPRGALCFVEPRRWRGYRWARGPGVIFHLG